MADTYILPVDGWADGAAPFSVPVQSVNPGAAGSGRIPAYPLHELPDDNAVPISTLIPGDTRALYVPKYALGQGASPLGLNAGSVVPTGYDWVTLNGQSVTFTDTFNGVSYVNEPIFARIV